MHGSRARRANPDPKPQTLNCCHAAGRAWKVGPYQGVQPHCRLLFATRPMPAVIIPRHPSKASNAADTWASARRIRRIWKARCLWHQAQPL